MHLTYVFLLMSFLSLPTLQRRYLLSLSSLPISQRRLCLPFLFSLRTGKFSSLVHPFHHDRAASLLFPSPPSCLHCFPCLIASLVHHLCNKWNTTPVQIRVGTAGLQILAIHRNLVTSQGTFILFYCPISYLISNSCYNTEQINKN